jgi:predicted transcriptional regulator
VTLLERFSVDTRETARDRRIDRLSDQIRRLTARIVDRSLNAEGPAEEIAALMERRDLLEKRRQRLLARTNPST